MISSRTKLAAIAGTLWLVGAGGTASAASFNCARAHQSDERAVCGTRALNDRDVTMALLYDLDRHFLPMGGRGALMDEQSAFLRERRQCGARRACLLALYGRRIHDLRAIIDNRVVTHGPF